MQDFKKLKAWQKSHSMTLRTLRRNRDLLRIALGSAGELEYHAILAGDLKFLSKTASTELIASAIEVKKILTGLLKAVRAAVSLRTEN